MNNYDAWNALQTCNPEPTLLDAIRVTVPEQRYKVVVQQDRCACDPREDMDLMCEIVSIERGATKQEELIYLISCTKGFDTACAMAYAADIDPPDLWDDEVCWRWLEQLADTELKVMEFHTGGRSHYPYLAYTTPEMCAKLGVAWENAEDAMQGEVSMFEQWADGDVYGYTLYEWMGGGDPDDEDDEDNWNECDSCGGFYGLDKDNGMRDHLPKEVWPLLDKALRDPVYD